MEHDQKELESQLVEVGKRLASPPSDVRELLSLLSKAENILTCVDQSPSWSMSIALYPVMKALAAKEHLNHSVAELKIFLASCFNEITRITAPKIPYNDNLMKDIFQVIVDVFGNLNDIHSPSYSKRITILETVANIRSCIIMLDLDCDDLILEMFQTFLKTIRASHAGNVFYLMETIMTLILKESDGISSELVSCLLDSVKMADVAILPIARRLGERVISNSAEKIKPYLVDLVNSMGASLNEFSGIVASICQGNYETPDLSQLSPSDKCLGSTILETEVEIVDEPPMLLLTNGTVSKGNGNSSDGGSPNRKHEPDDLDSTTVNSDCLEYQLTKNRIVLKSNLSLQLCSQTNTNKEAPAVASRKSSRILKKAERLRSDGQLCKQALSRVCLKPKKIAEVETSNIYSREQIFGSDDNKSMKEDIYRRDYVGKRLSRSGKVVLKENETDETTNSKKRDLKNTSMKGPIGNIFNRDSSGLQSSRIYEKKSTALVKVEDEDQSLKEMIYSSRSLHHLGENGITKSRRNHRTGRSIEGMVSSPKSLQQLKEASRTKSRRNRYTGPTEKLEAKDHKRKLNEDLVGSKIKVWWPADNMFYDGVVHSFDPASKKHKIMYNDGDEETLLLNRQRWEFINDAIETDAGQAKDIPSSANSSETGGNPSSEPIAFGTRSRGKITMADISRIIGRPQCRDSKPYSTSIGGESSETLNHSKEKDAKLIDDSSQTNLLSVTEPHNSENDFLMPLSSFKKGIAKKGSKLNDALSGPVRILKAETIEDVAVESDEQITPKFGQKPRKSGESDSNVTCGKSTLPKQEADGSAEKIEVTFSRRVRRKRGEMTHKALGQAAV